VDPFYIGAAEGTSWPLGLDDVESALASRFPGIATRRDRAVVADQAYLIFDTPVGDRTIECMYVHHVSLTVSGCELHRAREHPQLVSAPGTAGHTTVA